MDRGCGAGEKQRTSTRTEDYQSAFAARTVTVKEGEGVSVLERRQDEGNPLPGFRGHMTTKETLDRLLKLRIRRHIFLQVPGSQVSCIGTLNGRREG